MRFAKNSLHDTSKVLRLPRKMTMVTSKVLPRKLPRIFWKRRKSIARATQNDFRHVTKHVWMSPSATPATRNEATKRWKPPKMTRLCRTYHRHGHTGIARTVADGCDRERNVERANPQPLQTRRVKREPLLRIREKERFCKWFCSFPQRHGEATGKPETRDETRGSIKRSISCEISSNFHTL